MGVRLLGIHEYFRRLSGDRMAEQRREILTTRLFEKFRAHATDEWPWFEAEVSYGGARLPHALILGGRWTGQREALDTGLRGLKWLMRVRTNGGRFRATGAAFARDSLELPAQLDQVPGEAFAVVAACIEAYAATHDPAWREEARRSFEWFLGRNDLGESLYDPATGGCCDTLHVDRRNLNQGAKSTLAFLLSLQEMRLLEIAVQSFDQPVVAGDFSAVPAALPPSRVSASA